MTTPPPRDYPAIEDHALIGDGTTAALVATDATVDWLCLPRFDGPGFFVSLLDAERGGRWLLQPEGLVSVRQEYLPRTAVVRTELRARHEGRDGVVEVLDALPLAGPPRVGGPTGTGELVRLVRVLDGEVELRSSLRARGGVEVSAGADELALRWPHGGRDLTLSTTRPVPGLERLEGRVRLRAGEAVGLVLRWADGPTALRTVDDVAAALERTAERWREWTRQVAHEGPYTEDVVRSAITLKLCDHHENGALVAAPTSSLPEGIGGERNWDYRFTWVRDAAYSVYALRRIGLEQESGAFLRWVLSAFRGQDRPKVLYTLDGTAPADEFTDPHLRGYRGSAPVRWGNAAADQVQHDVYGEVLDCAWQWAHHGGEVDEELWGRLRGLAVTAEENWRTPDHGIWEIRDAGRPFTYSVAMCQVAADRTARLARLTGRDADAERFGTLAATVRETLLREAVGERGHFTEHLGEGEDTLDASLLALPLRRVVEASDPRMVRTVEAVVDRLGAGDGLVYRYLPHESPDGLAGDEGAFLLCSFWWADNLVHSGRLDDGVQLFESLLARTNHVGLLPEQVDAGTGAFLGNFPQAFSHIGLVSTAVNIARHTGGAA
ncbi:glycoside hydrolase family 15 protein [Kineococcus terrestris]|uniref:glycoside hydrolase family 15 protein n=1 Tax=Kineococcus terrestris TaxID=2044856 RepID=UPI0034DB4DAC